MFAPRFGSLSDFSPWYVYVCVYLIFRSLSRAALLSFSHRVAIRGRGTKKMTKKKNKKRKKARRRGWNEDREEKRAQERTVAVTERRR